MKLAHKIATTAIIIVLVISVVITAAQFSLPGQKLYSMKVNFNEEVLGQLKFSPESKAQYTVGRIVNRLTDAQNLALKNGLNVANGDQLEVQLDNHWNTLKQQLQTVENQNQYDKIENILLDFLAVTLAQDKIITRLVHDHIETTSNLNRHLAWLLGKKVQAFDIRKRIEKQILAQNKDLTKNIVQSAGEASKNSTEKVKNLVAGLKNLELKDWANNELTEIDKALKAADDNLEKDPAGAFSKYLDIKQADIAIQYIIEGARKFNIVPLPAPKTDETTETESKTTNKLKK